MNDWIFAVVIIAILVLILVTASGLYSVVETQGAEIKKLQAENKRMRADITKLSAADMRQIKNTEMYKCEVYELTEEQTKAIADMQNEIDSWKIPINSYFEIIQEDYLKTHK